MLGCKEKARAGKKVSPAAEERGVEVDKGDEDAIDGAPKEGGYRIDKLRPGRL